MLRPGRFACPASVRTFTLELSLPLSPSEASSMTTRVNSQFPRLDSHQLDTQHYGLRAKQSPRCWKHWIGVRDCSGLGRSSTCPTRGEELRTEPNFVFIYGMGTL